MSLVEPSCQYCTPTTGGHAPGCPMRLRAISTRAEWQGPPGPSCQYCTLTTLGHAPGCPTGTSVSGVTTSWRERAERAEARTMTVLASETALRLENSKLTARVAELEAETALLKEHVADGTDLAMPAWWRGEDHGVKATVQRIETMLTEPDTGGTFGYAPLNRLRERIVALRAVAEAAERAYDGWRVGDDVWGPLENLRIILAAWRATT